jgi:predicted O-methyltransferase YrrM
MIIKYSKTSFLDHPVSSLKYFLGDKESLHEKVMMRTGRILLKDKFNQREAVEYLREIRQSDFVKMNQSSVVQITGNKPGHLFGKLIYFLVRCVKPEVMIETGVAHGVSSWTILNAMHKNQKGKLYSIDLPNLDTKKMYNVENVNQQPGWVVPEILRKRWILEIGRSSDLLPPLLKKLGTVDIFFHDSDHSYENMMYEFQTTFDFIKRGGIIISDDVHKNPAFSEFVNEKGITAVQLLAKGGVAVKK